MLRIGVLQLSVSDDPDHNLVTTLNLINDASEKGATHIFTPEVTNGIITSPERRKECLSVQDLDQSLAAIQDAARNLKLWINIGSLALKQGVNDKLSNRSILIGPDGQIVTTYDKIHMFDAAISETQRYEESKFYVAGEQAVLAYASTVKIGMTICYDIRFPSLYRDLAKAGAELITIPSAFTVETGGAHFETLLRARAIETGCFVVAACQTGKHSQADGSDRETYGHSMVISPWGEILVDLGTDIGFHVLDLDLAEVERARLRIPSLKNDQIYKGP